MPPPPTLQLRLSNLAQIEREGAPPVPLVPRDAALLAWLAIEGPTTRQRLCALLWPGSSEAQARSTLRQRLFKLKKQLGTDVAEGLALLALAPGIEHDLHDAVELLADMVVTDAPELDQWLAQQREQRQQREVDGLTTQAQALEDAGEAAAALPVARSLLRLRPLSEAAHQRMIRLLYLTGDRAAALLAFDRCERALKDDVGATPSTETLDLLTQIERSEALTAPIPRRVVPASVLRPPRLIGRDAEWALLQAAWERGDAVVVIGEAGMGKTRLVDDLLRAHASAPGRALQASARQGDERVPYALIGRLLRNLLATRTEVLADGVQLELARLLPELPQRAVAGGNDDSAQARFVGALESTLRDAVAAGLEAVALDDLHFADAASLEMTQHLAGIPGLRWLTAFRGAEIGPAVHALVDTLTTRLGAEPVVLQPLTSAQVADLLDSLGLFGAGALDAADATALAGALHHRSGGNPLFLLETLKALLSQREPARDGAGAVGLLAQLPHSSSALRLIERRIGLLSRDAVRLARCAAVAGQDFSATLAAQVLDVNPLDLADAWIELESAQVLRDGAFAHDLIFDAARASVPQPIARALHRRIAELLAADGAAPARLATHWLGAGEELRAAPHLAEAGRHALRALRVREGLEYLDQAQSIYGRAGDADAQCSLIDELIAPAILASAFDNVQRLVEQAALSASSDRQRAMTLRSLASLLEQRCEYERATETGLEALSAALAARDRACELGARALLAELMCARCQAGEGQEVLRPIEHWVYEHGSAQQQIVYADAMAKVLLGSGDLAQSLVQWQRAIDIARTNGASHALPNLLMMRAITLIYTGRAQEGRDALVDGRQLLHDIPEDSMALRSFTIRLQVIDRMLGHYTSSMTFGELVLSDPTAGPAEIEEVWLPQAFAFCDLGQPARAHQLLAQSQAPAGSYVALIWKEIGAQLPRPGAQLEAAHRQALDAAAEAASKWAGQTLLTAWRIQARHGEDEIAVAAARRGVEFASASGMQGQQLVFQALLAWRLAKLGDTSQAVWLARDSWRLMAEFCPGLVYRGVVWRALIEVLEPHDAALARAIAQHAADWIFRTAAEHVPPAYRESFLHRNPFNAFLLGKARER